MNMSWTARLRLLALAAAGCALIGVSAPAQAAATRPVTPLNGWSGKLGPGLGSAKTPFGVIEAGRPLNVKSEGRLYFHTRTGQPVPQSRIWPLGPGLRSVKSPGNNRA